MFPASFREGGKGEEKEWEVGVFQNTLVSDTIKKQERKERVEEKAWKATGGV